MGNFEQNLALIHLKVLEKTGFINGQMNGHPWYEN